MGILSSFSFLPPCLSHKARLFMRQSLRTFYSKKNKATISAGDILQKLSEDYPHVEVIRYEHKNLKWTLKHINHFSNALAIGFLDVGFKPGDVVLSWLPSHFSEQHILQFACSKAGFIHYHLDPFLAMRSTDRSKKALEKALNLTESNILITQEAGNDINYVKLVEGVIPETRIFNIGDGMPFFTPRFPSLRYIVQTGLDFDDKPGIIPLNQMLCPNGELNAFLEGTIIDSHTPLAGKLITDIEGIPTGIEKILSNEQVINEYVWPEFVSILKKEYKEVKGIGVIF